jgi:hypothetical protein
LLCFFVITKVSDGTFGLVTIKVYFRSKYFLMKELHFCFDLFFEIFIKFVRYLFRISQQK